MNQNSKQKMKNTRKERQTGKANIAPPRNGRKRTPGKLEPWRTDAVEFRKKTLAGAK